MSQPLTSVIKRGGKRPSEAYTQDKLHASIVAACLSVRSHEGEAESTATKVCNAVADWLSAKPEVTSNDIRRKATEALTTYNPEAAYLYKHHRSVI